MKWRKVISGISSFGENKKNCLSDHITEYRMYRNKFILNEIDLIFVVAGKLDQFEENRENL